MNLIFFSTKIFEIENNFYFCVIDYIKPTKNKN